jgi:hypothetical protein
MLVTHPGFCTKLLGELKNFGLMSSGKQLYPLYPTKEPSIDLVRDPLVMSWIAAQPASTFHQQLRPSTPSEPSYDLSSLGIIYTPMFEK